MSALTRTERIGMRVLDSEAARISSVNLAFAADLMAAV